MTPAIAVFTEKSAESIITAGGSGAWILNPRSAGSCRYIVCCRKSAASAAHGHGSAFLVGLIKSLIPVGENDRGQRRYHVAIDEYAAIDLPGAWAAWRNPVKYTTLEDLGIDPAKLKFLPMPAAPDRTPEELRAEIPRRTGKLTIQQAKQGLAEMFGVSIDDIEITIRS